MKDIKEKIQYIYHNIDGIYYFLANTGINDHSKRCVLRRFFILVDSYFEMIGYLKNNLFKYRTINITIKKSIEDKIASIKKEWDKNYEIIRNKYSAHHQEVDDLILLEWWNEIDYSTITYFYKEMNEIRAIITQHANVLTLTPTDYFEIDFSDTCLKERDEGVYYLAHDRLAISKKNTVGIISGNEFQRKCMLILSIVDFIFINCSLTRKTENYTTHYNKILFDSAWLLLCCDTYSLIENMYEDSDYGSSLLSLSPPDWKGKLIIEDGSSNRDKPFEENLKILRNNFAAHIDTKKEFTLLVELFDDFDLKRIHENCILNMQIFQRACISDIRTKMFAFRDQRLSTDILGISFSGHKTIDK
ncbi:MAG TPA: hypothetical protein VGK27_06825 [Candidatus Deferrimicrobiaceae bacterium]|jgi:hypothetical protein